MIDNFILDQIVKIVGDPHIKKGNKICTVFPYNTEEIRQIIELANQNKLNLFTKTCDDDFHYISEINSDGIILDLTRMNKIQKIDVKSRSVNIEPGVSFFQLQKELKKYGLRAINPIGLHASNSVLNAYVERIPLLSAPKPLLANGWQCLLDMEVILPTGGIIKTGASSIMNMEKPFFWPFGCGPDLSRVISASQGSLGLATNATIKVKRIPESRKLLLFGYDKLDDSIDLLYRIQRDDIGEECIFMNNFTLSNLLSEDSSEFEKYSKNLPNWILILCLIGPEGKIKYQEEDLIDLGAITITKSPMIENIIPELLDEFFCPQRISRLLEFKKVCRKISFYTTLDKIPSVNIKVNNLIQSYNYPLDELGAFITPVELGRACFIEYYIFANLSKKEEKEKMEKLYIEIYELLINLGANIDRPFGNVVKMVYSGNPTYREFLKSVKNQLDPNNIMNANRFEI